MNKLRIFRHFHQTPIWYYPIHRELMGRVTSAIVFAYLIRQTEFKNSDTLELTDKNLMEITGLTKAELRTAKEDLLRTRFFKIERVGDLAKNHYTAEWVAIEKALSQMCGISTSRCAELTHQAQTHISIEKKYSVGTRRQVPTLSMKWIAMAEKLRDAMSAVRKVNFTCKMDQWGKQFELLHSKNGVDTKRIRKVLDWYCRNLKDRNRTPMSFVVESGYAFREKFLRMEIAMDKEQTEAEQNGEHRPDPTYKGKATITSREHVTTIGEYA